MEIQGFNNYLIYDDGLVFNQKSNKFIRWYKKYERNKKYYYYRVGLTNHKGKTKYFYVHRLIAIHYIANPYNYPQVDHIDGNRQNNDISNLRWVTNETNMNSFRSHRSDNTSGHKNIHYDNTWNKWGFQKRIYGKEYTKYFKTKIDCLCYKYIFNLKKKSGLLE